MQPQAAIVPLLDQMLATNAAALSNLSRTGLFHPDALIAYRAALSAGANAENSWEAARQAQLLAIRVEVRAAEAHGRRLSDHESEAELALHDHELREAQNRFDATHALPNPFEMPRAAA